MVNLFNRCLNAEYIHCQEDGDYAIQVKGNVLYILFEWSDSTCDWFNNFDFPAKPYRDMDDKWYAHRGFLRVWKAMQDSVEEEVQQALLYNDQVDTIKCVGYSHGAAIALLATEDMSYLHGKTLTVEGYGFGCPRVIWGKMPESLKERLKGFTAIRNIPDIVTHVPPWLFGYRHINLNKVGKLGRYGLVKAHYAEAYTKELANKDGDCGGS